MDYSFLKTNPLYVLVAFVVFHFVIAPMLGLDTLKSLLLFVVLYIIFMKFGKDWVVSKMGSGFGKRRRR